MHCTKMHHFCGLKFASFHAICIYCIISMHPTHAPCMLHLTHNHLCIVLGLPRPSNQAQGSLTRHTSGIFIPLHISSSGFFNPQHCILEIFISLHCHHISRDLYPTSYHGISIPLHCIAYQGSLSHCISHLRDFTPTALHIMRSKCHCITYQGISIPLHSMGSQPHCIAYHCISHPRVFTPSHHEIIISVHISTSPSIASLLSSTPNNSSSYP